VQYLMHVTAKWFCGLDIYVSFDVAKLLVMCHF